MSLAEARDRRVIGHSVRADDAEGDVLAAAPLDRPARALANRVGIEQQRDHHPRVVGDHPAILAVVSQKRVEAHRLDRVDQKPGEMILRQPLSQARREEKVLLPVARNEVE